MTRAIVMSVVLVHGIALAASTRLQVTSRPVRSSARVTYSSTDALAGLDKGAGGDPSAISATLFVRVDGATTRFVVPADAYDGRSGWIANDAARALFTNRDAPGGPTGTMRTLFANGRRVKMLAKSLGDQSPFAFAAAPSTDVEIAYVVTNDGETHEHCARFAASSCRYTPIDAGTGWKVRCLDGTADLACGAASICGNGIVEHGEQCDSGAGCSPDCHQGIFSCCQSENQCIAAPIFSLQFYLLQYCQSFAPGSTPRAGEVCGEDGACADHPIDPVPVCCQEDDGVCHDDIVSTVAGVWFAQYYCLSGSGIGSGRYIVVNADCNHGTCVPR
jgi:hypothetical protein